MFVRIKSNPSSPRKSVQIVESRRIGTKVSQIIVRHIGTAKSEIELKALTFLADCIRKELEAQRTEMIPVFGPEQLARPYRHKQKRPFQIKATERVRLSDLKEETRIAEGIHDVFGKLFRDLKFHHVLDNTTLSQVLEDCVLARVAQPPERYRTAAMLENDFAISIPLDQIRKMMEMLPASREQVLRLICEATLNLSGGKCDSAYVFLESFSLEDSFPTDRVSPRVHGRQRRNQSSVTLAIAMTNQGLPLGCHLLPDGTGITSSLMDYLSAWRHSGEIGRLTVVTDRSIITTEAESALRNANIQYVVRDYARDYDLTGAVLYWAPRMNLLCESRKELNFQKESLLKTGTATRHIRSHFRTRLAQVVRYEKSKLRRSFGVILNGNNHFEPNIARLFDQFRMIRDSFAIKRHHLVMGPITSGERNYLEGHILICFMALALLQQARYRVSLQQQAMDIDQIRNELLRVQVSVLKDKATGARYRMPSGMSISADLIYKTFGLKRNMMPEPILS